MLAFLVLPLAGIVYALWHVWCVLPWPAAWRWAAVAVCVVAFAAVPLNLTRTIDRMPMPLATVCYEVGNSSLVVLLYVVMAFLVLDVGRLVRLVPRSVVCANGVTAAVLALLLVAVFVCGNLHYRNKVRQTVDLVTDKPLDRPLTIVMMSDLHLGYHNRADELDRWVDLVNAEHPDLVLLAGDLIDISVRPLLAQGMAARLRRLDAPVYACLGNHEYYSGEPAAQAFYEAAGITLLRDSVALAEGVCLVGRDDRTNRRRRSLADLMKSAPADRYTILLDHQPYHLEQAERRGVDFQFSGHTHHGQVWPASWVTERLYEDAYGPLRKGRTRYYVSSGMGIWGGKFRIGTCSEYVVATLRHAGT